MSEFESLVLRGICLVIQLVADLKPHDYHKGLWKWTHECDQYIEKQMEGK